MFVEWKTIAGETKKLCSVCWKKLYIEIVRSLDRERFACGEIACVHKEEQHEDLNVRIGGKVMLTFDDLLAELRFMHDKKNHDYAGAASGDPLDNFKKVGERVVCEHCHQPVGAVVACQVLRTTKAVRLENLALRKEPTNESIEDSLKDEAVYSLLETLLRHERNNQGETKDDF